MERVRAVALRSDGTTLVLSDPSTTLALEE
jgi:hypothetical protein